MKKPKQAPTTVLPAEITPPVEPGPLREAVVPAAGFPVVGIGASAGGLSPSSSSDVAARRRAFDARQLVMLQKFVAAEDGTDVIRQAMAVFGGNGVIEDFSCLPRLFRDSSVNEPWEGPRNVLQAQIHRDLQRASTWYPAGEFVADVLAGASPSTVAALAHEFTCVVAHPGLEARDAETVAMCRRWDRVCRDLFHAFQDVALREVEANPEPAPDREAQES